MIRVIRLEDQRAGAGRPGARAAEVVDRLYSAEREDYTPRLRYHWNDLPVPDLDPCVITGSRVSIRSMEKCGSVDARMFHRWWPEWAINALTDRKAQHDVTLDVYEADPDAVRVLHTQVLFNQPRSRLLIRIPLAASGLTFNDVVAYLNNQNAYAVARGDRYAPLTLNA